MFYFLVFLIIIVIVSVAIQIQREKHLAGLKQKYEKLLRGSDKRAALEAGRSYYSALRKDKSLTIYDEQAISNDLTTMN